MRIVISGGSNSLRKGGYASHLAAAAGADHEIINISLGAAPSLMGFFQQQRVGDLRAGDVLVLEYALNDLNHLAQKGYRASDLLRSVELVMRSCAERGIRLLPVIMRPLRYERLKPAPKLHTELGRLFDSYGLSHLDVSAMARERLGVARLSAAHYEDVNHYKPNGEVVRLVAEEVSKRLDDCRVPQRPASPLYCGEDQTLEIVTELQGGTQSVFANSAGEVCCYRPDETPVFARADRDSILVGMVVLASTSGGVLRVESGDRTFLLSLRHDHKRFDKPAVKLISLDNLLDPPLSIAAGAEVKMTWSDTQDGALIDLGFRQPATAHSAAREGGVVGLILETGTRPVTIEAPGELPEGAPRRAREPARRQGQIVKGVDGRARRAVTQQKVELRKVNAMTTSEAAAARKAPAPMDAEGFVQLLETVERFTTVVERTLRQAAPRISLAQYLALRTLAAGNGGDAKTPKVKPATLKRLAALGYVSEGAEGAEHEVTATGRKTLEDVSALIDSVTAHLGSGKHPVGAGPTRPLAKVTMGLRKLKTAEAA